VDSSAEVTTEYQSEINVRILTRICQSLYLTKDISVVVGARAEMEDVVEAALCSVCHPGVFVADRHPQHQSDQAHVRSRWHELGTQIMSTHLATHGLQALEQCR